jgi:tetratricopeptide (TPR) repeat protein
MTFLIGSTLVVPAEEFDLVRMFKHMKYHNTGADFYEAGQYKKALKFLNKAIEIDPSDPISYEVKAKVYLELKQYNKAWDNVKKAQSIAQGLKKSEGSKKIYSSPDKSQQIKLYEVDPVFLEKLRKASGRNE